ncbi:low molecular weight protein arginine phosphatase|uniref:Protein-tyrosine phosphatase n=1 Tax=Dendrosporobacter quercicolus TaxID=146817 RepID=A0A1G9QS41_9FIRM|nr:low molecular weight protein arginine phosphatase [Dendrosporobacter quercicolus]NSL48344.1 low molecular weight protein arginine phosphatase [Dendrosporobacter quercicolus DSM 1736]SDM13804.1 protein-tyrosine phosphatase [Dendrosporobacter quercicolus]
MLRILFVCTGNTCRSPMAEAILKEKVRQHQLEDKIRVFSAGVAAGAEAPASTGAYLAMSAKGIDLTSHYSRQLLPKDVEAADLVLTMTAGHKGAVLHIVPSAGDKLYTLAEFAGGAGQVTDPFGGSAEIYQACAAQIEQLLEQAWEKITALAGKKG